MKQNVIISNYKLPSQFEKNKTFILEIKNHMLLEMNEK
jgi:hypothetical protein